MKSGKLPEMDGCPVECDGPKKRMCSWWLTRQLNVCFVLYVASVDTCDACTVICDTRPIEILPPTSDVANAKSAPTKCTHSPQARQL